MQKGFDDEIFGRKSCREIMSRYSLKEEELAAYMSIYRSRISIKAVTSYDYAEYSSVNYAHASLEDIYDFYS